jgi:predicted Fe-S protein YdhL (DUF1289 family)
VTEGHCLSVDSPKSDPGSPYVRPVAAPGTINSPCIKVCIIDSASNLCRGCLRTLDEIANWSGMDNGGKQAVLDRVAEREQAKPEWKIKY